MTQRKPSRKPVRIYHCPACGYGEFAVVPAGKVVVVHSFHDNGDKTVAVRHTEEDDADRVTCTNCGWSGTWSEVDSWRRPTRTA